MQKGSLNQRQYRPKSRPNIFIPVIQTETTGGDLGNLRGIVAATVFRIIQIVLLPVGAVIYVVFVVKLVAQARHGGLRHRDRAVKDETASRRD
jgi:hypothetical protein